MAYRVYSGPRGSQPLSPLDKDKALHKEFSTLDEALGWAHHVDGAGGVVQRIEGDDGTVLSKEEVTSALRHYDAGGAG